MTSLFIWVMTTLEVLAALLIIVLVLLQKSKSGGGLGGIAGGGGGATEEVFGSQTTSILSKATVVLCIFFLVNTLALTVVQKNYRLYQGDVERHLIEGATAPDQIVPEAPVLPATGSNGATVVPEQAPLEIEIPAAPVPEGQND